MEVPESVMCPVWQSTNESLQITDSHRFSLSCQVGTFRKQFHFVYEEVPLHPASCILLLCSCFHM